MFQADDNKFSLYNPLAEYLIDAYQRTVLYWDVMRQRGNQYIKHMQEAAPNVLQFDYEPIINGKTLREPVNYSLERIIPPERQSVERTKRPFVVVDPRAGHGPGIGGFKAESEIGVAIRAGHPCYFIGFSPMPEPGQTIEAIMNAEAIFLEKIIERHPDSEGKPVIIGNCQAGWAVMMLAAIRPELCGPIILAGSPLSYWAGVRGANPMRYSGGLLGGSWLTALTGDIGNGKFDGAWLVQNFENQNPANTLWAKQYNLYEKIDTEAPRYLGFERWWSGHVVLNSEEMQYIVDNLFVGNKLSTAQITTKDGLLVDPRNIKSPVICFCSKGDNITPPQQALGWITDLYASVDDIRAAGQTIVYAVHESVGHLGIFVAGNVARKEHQEFAHNIDFIDCLPPGLYEAVIEDIGPETVNADLVNAEHISRYEARTLDDIRAMGCNTLEEERCFAAVERLSEINLGLYRTLWQPAVRAMADEQTAGWLRRLHPLRLGYEAVSDRNPLLKNLEKAAGEVRRGRRKINTDNIFWQWQKMVSDSMAESLDTFRRWSEYTCEQMFFTIYDNPLLQAMLGLRASDDPPRRRPGQDPVHRAFVEQSIRKLRQDISKGGAKEAVIRSVLYIRMPEKAPDERAFEMLNRIRKTFAPEMNLSELKNLIREQFLMLLLDERRTVKTLPLLLKGHEEDGPQLLELIRMTVTAKGELSGSLQRRYEDVAGYFQTRQQRRRTDGGGRQAGQATRPSSDD